MTDKEKQSCGQLYNPTAGDICTMRKRGTDLACQFNSCEDPDEQKKILQTLFSETGENVRVNPPFDIDFGCHTHIGNDTVINLNCTFLDDNLIIIGDNALIAPNVQIYTAFHPTNAGERFGEMKEDGSFAFCKTQTAPVRIGSNVWIGGGAIIMPGVKIGDNVVIGAGSVVTRDIPSDKIAYGNPCRVMRDNL